MASEVRFDVGELSGTRTFAAGATVGGVPVSSA